LDSQASKQQDGGIAVIKRVENEPLDDQTLENICADLCSKVDTAKPVPQGFAKKAIFGVMATCAEDIPHVEFNLVSHSGNITTIPLPFTIDRSEEVMLLNLDDSKAFRASYSGAIELFRKLWNGNETSILISESNNGWAIVVNEDGGVSYWHEKNLSIEGKKSTVPGASQ
jgi:hypothetical protein